MQNLPVRFNRLTPMKRALAVLTFYAFSGAALAADGDLVTAFGASPFPGVAAVAFDRAGSIFDDRASAAVATAEGIVVVGAVASPSGGSDIGIIRLSYTGHLDTTFGSLGRTVVPIDLVQGGIDRPNNVALDPVGRIVIGAAASTQQGAAPVLVRLSANGMLDGSFGGGGFRVLEDLQYEFRGPGAFAVAGPDSSVFYAAIAQSNRIGSSPELYIGKLPANGLGDSVFGTRGRMTVGFAGAIATSVGDLRLSGSNVLVCGGATANGQALWTFASTDVDASLPTSALVAASESSTPNAGDHVCTSVRRSRFFAGRIYLGGGGRVAGKNGVVVAAVNSSGIPDPGFSGDGFFRSTVLDSQTYITLDDVIERSSGDLAFAGSIDRPGTGTDAYLGFLLNSGELSASGTRVFELFEDARGSRLASVVERDARLYATGWLQVGPTDPGDFNFLALKTVRGERVVALGFE